MEILPIFLQTDPYFDYYQIIEKTSEYKKCRIKKKNIFDFLPTRFQNSGDIFFKNVEENQFDHHLRQIHWNVYNEEYKDLYQLNGTTTITRKNSDSCIVNLDFDFKFVKYSNYFIRIFESKIPQIIFREIKSLYIKFAKHLEMN
jgi:hypothetical protein